MLWLRPLRQTLVSFAAMSGTAEAGAGNGGAAARVLISQPAVFARKKAKFVAEGPGKLQVGFVNISTIRPRSTPRARLDDQSTHAHRSSATGTTA